MSATWCSLRAVNCVANTGEVTPYPLSPIYSSLLFLEAPASGEASLLSEGLRESLSSYISLTEENSLDDA